MNERYHLRRCAQSSQPARRLARGISTGPYKTPPKTAVWFIKPRNTVIGDGEAIPYPQGETVQSGATVALIVGKTARKVAAEEAANYIAGYALANDVSLPEESFIARRSKPSAAMASAPSARYRRYATSTI